MSFDISFFARVCRSLASLIHTMCNNPQVETPASSKSTYSSDINDKPETTLQSFTCFLKLPTEIRLMIYRETFGKPNHIHLDGNLIHIPRSGIYGDPWKHKGSLPLMLHVSSESRAEVLRHFKMLLQGKPDEIREHRGHGNVPHIDDPGFSFPTLVTVPEAIWFSSCRDSAYITLEHDASYTTHQLLQSLRNPSYSGQIVASTVRSLEIRIVMCHCSSPIMPIISFNNKRGRAIKDLLLLFKELEKLCITLKHVKLHNDFIPLRVLQDIGAWLEQEKSHFNSDEPPEVYFAPLQDGGTAMPTPQPVPSPSITPLFSSMEESLSRISSTGNDLTLSASTELEYSHIT